MLCPLPLDSYRQLTTFIKGLLELAYSMVVSNSLKLVWQSYQRQTNEALTQGVNLKNLKPTPSRHAIGFFSKKSNVAISTNNPVNCCYGFINASRTWAHELYKSAMQANNSSSKLGTMAFYFINLADSRSFSLERECVYARCHRTIGRISYKTKIAAKAARLIKTLSSSEYLEN